MANIPNEHLVSNFKPNEKRETVEQGKKMDGAGVASIDPAALPGTAIVAQPAPAAPTIGFANEPKKIEKASSI